MATVEIEASISCQKSELNEDVVEETLDCPAIVEGIVETDTDASHDHENDLALIVLPFTKIRRNF